MATTYMQYGDARKANAIAAQKVLGHILGPIPRYLYGTLTPEQLALEIEKRWVARRMEMSQRIVVDNRVLRYMDPERVQDHWQNFWTGEPSKKLQHSTQLAIGVFNWPRVVVESLTSLIVGQGQSSGPYTLDVTPWDRRSPAAALQSDLVEQFIGRWQSQPHEGAFQELLHDRAENIVAVGRNWDGIWIDADRPLSRARNVGPQSVASFWQSDKRTLECVIVASEMLPGEAAALYPEKETEIARAVHSPASWFRVFDGGPSTTWDLNSTVTLLTCWYRTTKNTVGQAVVLTRVTVDKPFSKASTVLLSHTEDTKYPDIPLKCVPRFKTADRPPDESQGILFDIAPIVTMLDETVSAARDMLHRAIYQRYVLSNAYGKPPTLIPGTSIIALRAGQDLKLLEQVLQNTPVDTFIARLEEYIRIFPGLSDYFIGRIPPTETSGEAIARSMNASITRLAITTGEFASGELWQTRQLIGQASAYYKAEIGGRTISLAPVLTGDYKLELTWQHQNPAEASKARQLALGAYKAGVISLDTAQKAHGVVSTIDEQRKIRAERMDPVLRPDIVQLTAGARGAMLNYRLAEARAAQPPQPQTPPVRISLSGQVDPLTAAKLAEQASQIDLVPGGPVGGEGDAAGQAVSARDTVSGQMSPVATESDNSRVMDLEGEPPG